MEDPSIAVFLEGMESPGASIKWRESLLRDSPAGLLESSAGISTYLSIQHSLKVSY